MSDNSFEDAEMFLLIEKLVTADSWDNAFALLMQKKETLSEPNAEEYLLARIEQKKLQNAPLAEIDNLAMYLPLLRDMRTESVPVSWAAFTCNLLDDEIWLLVQTAFSEFEDAATDAEMRQIFAHNRSLFLSEAAELFRQHLLASVLCDASAEMNDMIDALRHLKTFFDLQRLGKEEDAWDLLAEARKRLITKDQQQAEVFNVLSALEVVERPEELFTLLIEKQATLLTTTAHQLLEFFIEQIEGDSRNPRLNWLQQLRHLLECALLVGIQQAINENGLSVYDALFAEQQLFVILYSWVDVSNVREQRKFLEQHLEIVQMRSVNELQSMMEAEVDNKDGVAILDYHLNILNEILQHGGRSMDIRDTYVNYIGGLALDIPAWLEPIEVQIQHLTEQPERGNELIAVLGQTITLALQNGDVALETIATLKHKLGMALKATAPEDVLYAANLEEALAAQRSALQIFTVARYPIQYAYAQIELGMCFFYRVEGSRNDNIEQGLACLQTALKIFPREMFPAEWGEIHLHLGNVYQERIAGEKGDNIEQALIYMQAALEIFQQETFPFEWASIQYSQGLLFWRRVYGEKNANHQQAIQHFQRTFQVYTHETFPVEWAISHCTLGAFYTDYGLSEDQEKDRFVLALEHYQQAEKVLTTTTFPEKWASLQEGIMTVFISRMDGYKYAHLQHAIEQGKMALSILANVFVPLGCAAIHVRLSEAYSLLVSYANTLVQADLLEQALQHIQIALQTYMPEKTPKEWANAQRIQGEIYLGRIKGVRKENLDRARHCCQLALRVIEQASEDWPTVQIILGAVLLAYPEKQKEDIEQAIVCFNASLARSHPIVTAMQYIRNRICLCQAYIERIEGDPQQNIEIAIKHGQEALEILTRHNASAAWAEVHFYLGNASIKRTAGERRVNLELAIQHFEYAAEMFTRASAPLLWAGIQVSLCIVYAERSEGGHVRKDALLAMQYAQEALQIYTEKTTPREWPVLQIRLGQVCQYLIQNPTDDFALQAEKHYRLALQSYTRTQDVLNAAKVQLLLGGYYQSQAHSGSRAADKQQALTCYQAASQAFTRETTPVPWAMVQLGLGLSHFASGSVANEHEQAVYFLKQAMSILTSEAFPYIHRGILNLNLLIEWKRGNWREVARLSQAIYEIEQALLSTSTGTSGLDKILTHSLKPSHSAYGAFALLLQKRTYQMLASTNEGWAQDLARSLILNSVEPEYIEQAAITLERGRALELARTVSLYLAAPERIQNPERRTRYTNALEHLRQARAALIKLASFNNEASVTLDERQRFLDGTSACAVAQQTFDELLIEIRGAQDPADFLADPVNREMFQQVLRHMDPGHTLVYLVALEDVGSFALAIQAPRKLTNHPLLFEVCMLPGLTSDSIHTLVQDGAEQRLSVCQEKLTPLLLLPLLRWLQKSLKPSSLTLIPCGYLTGLPLANLLLDADKTLGDYLPTSIALSALSLLHIPSSDRSRDGVYTFGNPRRNLQFAEAEADTLRCIAAKAGITSKWTVQEKITDKALRETIKHAMVVDLACHGKVKRDNYLQSYLELRLPLTLGTILDWQRDMQGLRLLILSACESAAADLNGAVDEVRSLSSAMLQAGTYAVLAPLWKVNDCATFLLMTRFAEEWFPHLKTEPPAAALARAQWWLRNVKNEELMHWETDKRILMILDKEQPETAPDTYCDTESKYAKTDRVFERPILSSETRDTETSIRQEASMHAPDLRPYADPMHWAGFQIVGW